jgi:uncharacterized protein DUF5679
MRKIAKLGLLAAAAVVAAKLLRRGGDPPPPPAESQAPAEAVEATAEAVEGYCVKERKKVRIKDPQPTMTKSGRQAVKGSCPDCGSKIFRFV